MKSRHFVYYQPNKKDLEDKVGDCQIRALSKALNLSWLETFDLTIPICRDLQTYTIFGVELKRLIPAMERLGFTYTGISNKKGTTRPTVESFAKDHPTGTYIVTVAHHVVAVVDGHFYDTWDCGHKSLYGYYQLTENKATKPEADQNRFSTKIRYRNFTALPYAAELVDHLTGCKFQNTYETREQCEEWLEWAKQVCIKGRQS